MEQVDRARFLKNLEAKVKNANLISYTMEKH